MATFRTSLAAIAAALFLAAQPAVAQPPVAAQAEDIAARRAKALELAQIVEPRDLAVHPAKLEAGFIQGLIALDDIRELEAEYPGMVRAVWQALAPEIQRDTLAALPARWAKLADIYSSHLTLQQLTEAAAFLGGPTGRKAIALGQEGAVVPAVTAGAMSEDGELSAADYLKLETAAVREMVKGLTREEQEQMAAFGQSPAGIALLSAAPFVQQATLEWVNASDPETDARMEALAADTMEAFMAAADRARRKTKRKP